jgi:predicted kinase
MTLIEFGGLPGTGKSTLALELATRMRAVLLRIDTIEGALWRNGLRPEQTGVAAYSVAHDLAAGHLVRGIPVVADAVNSVEPARAGWRELAKEVGVRHLVVETHCPDVREHRRRVETRSIDIPGFPRPSWEWVQSIAEDYEPRTDERLTLDTTQDIETCLRQLLSYGSDEPTDRET